MTSIWQTYGKYKVSYYANGEICGIVDITTMRLIVEPNSMFFRDEKEAILSNLVKGWF